jgi:hypothetical protein
MDHDEMTLWATIGTLGGTVIALAIEIALLAVALGPVRRHRPDVSGLFVGAAVLLLVATLSMPFVYAGASLLAARSAGAESVMRVNTLVGLFFGALRAGGSALMIAGIARLATPKRHDPRDPS